MPHTGRGARPHTDPWASPCGPVSLLSLSVWVYYGSTRVSTHDIFLDVRTLPPTLWFTMVGVLCRRRFYESDFRPRVSLLRNIVDLSDGTTDVRDTLFLLYL